MTRVIIIIIRMTASYLKAEHEIKQAVITVLVTPVCSQQWHFLKEEKATSKVLLLIAH